MASTPKQKFRPSLGEPSRVSRLRAQSPGASSVGSGEDIGTSPRRRALFPSGAGRTRALVSSRHSRDPRPVGDRAFTAQCAKNVVELLSARGYSKTFSHDKLLKDPSTKEFYDVFRFLIAQLDPQLEVEGKMEDEVPSIMRRLKYPVEVNRSKLQAISGPNTWPQLLAVLDWLTVLVRISDELIEPLAACQLGLSDVGDPDRDAGDHHVLRSLHENYLNFLSGKDDSGDEERLRMIYMQRLEALQAEIQRLENQQVEMQQRLQDFQGEHDRLLELQKMPAQLEVEADRLRSIIQAQEHKVQTIEDEMVCKEAEEREQQKEIETLQAKRAYLAEQVESQAYSRRDIERLHAERSHLRQLFKDLKAEGERADEEVWELGMQEKSRAEEIGRLVRQVNDTVECLTHALTEEEADIFDFRVRVDLSEPSDALASLAFDDQKSWAQAASSSHGERLQQAEFALHELLEEQRGLQTSLAEKEGEARHMRARHEQLTRIYQEYREWSASQIDDAQKTTEATEDAVHEISIGSAAPSLRDAAEVDKLKLTLASVQTQGAHERAQLEEQIRRDEERLEEHRQLIMRELDSYAKASTALCEDVEAALLERRSGSAWCAIGSFGGGLLGGDEVDMAVEVDSNATLTLVTQASTKIYRTNQDLPATQRFSVRIRKGGLLVLAPDPLVPFASSQYSQQMRFTLTPDTDASAGDGASAVIVDWLGAGRIASGERWAFDEYASRFEFVWEEDASEGTSGGKVKRPRLVEAVRLRRDDCNFLDHPLQSFDAFVTIFACGSQARRVVRRTKAVALLLAARAGARVRSEEASQFGGDNSSDVSLPQTKGQALMGVTTDENSGCTVIRLMAEHTEDVYRLLHVCLEPLASLLGAEPYADRVHGAGVFQIVQTKAGPASSAEPEHPKPAFTHELNLQQQFTLCHLTDATLPVGGFAHSGGIEAAVQLGLLSRQEGDIDGLRHFIKMLALSTFRLQGPFVRSAHRLGAKADGVPELRGLDEDLHAHLAGGLACRASLLQGAGLSRIGRRWCNLSGLPRNGHFASFFGLLCARLDLPQEVSVQAFLYCSVRDAVSAAVRLNLVGPLQAVELQRCILADLEHLQGDCVGDEPFGCAPLVDCAHAAHDLLEARLFLT
ncbi:ndc80 [Symbiodinium sp. CCMP2456]|nr:ndc80 [Symbiodinium sp. CCMP2456]